MNTSSWKPGALTEGRVTEWIVDWLPMSMQIRGASTSREKSEGSQFYKAGKEEARIWIEHEEYTVIVFIYSVLYHVAVFHHDVIKQRYIHTYCLSSFKGRENGRARLRSRGVTSFPWALVQGFRMGPCFTFKALSHVFLQYSLNYCHDAHVWTSPRLNA